MRAVVPAMVLLALLSGCSVLTDTSPETAVTPAPVPEPTTQRSPESAIAPGVGGAGVTDADRLARAHRRHPQSIVPLDRTDVPDPSRG